MTKRTKIAIAGLGSSAQKIHLPAYRKIPGLEIVGGCDPRAEELRSQFGFPVFTEANTLIAETNPDMLVVATPTPSHFELAQSGLQAGCHIFCEKPFTTDVHEAETLMRLAESADRQIVVNNQFRFMNIYQAARQAVGSKEFGDLQFLSASQTFYVDESTEAGWRGADPQRTCKEFGIHVLDLCRFFFAEEPHSITARMQRPAGEGSPDLLNLIQLEFSGSRFAQITLDRLTRGRHRYLDLRLDGTRAVVETELGGRLELRAGVMGGNRRPFVNFDYSGGGSAMLYTGQRGRKIASDPLNVFSNATQKLMEAYLAALDMNRTPPCAANDNVKTLSLMLAAYESDDARRTLAVATP